MKAERIKPGEVYMVVIGNKEIRVKIELVELDTIVGTRIDEKRGIACPASRVVAGPLKLTARLP